MILHHRRRHYPLFLFLLLPILCKSIAAVDFVFNGFNSSDVSIYGSAIIESGILTLTNRTSFTIGRALYPLKIPTKPPNSSRVYPFSTSFIFAMAPYKNTLPGHGLVFLFVPFSGIHGATASQNLGLFNRTNDGNPNNHVLGVEFDVFQNQEFNDINANHIGIDVNSLTSRFAEEAGYWPDNLNSSGGGGRNILKLNDGRNYQVWIDYADSLMNVSIAPVRIKRPRRPLLNVSLNLSDVFEDEMYVGFTAATGQLVQSHKILAWSFSNSNFSLSESLITTGLPSFVLPKDPIVRAKWFIAVAVLGSLVIVVSVALVTFLFIRRKIRRDRERDGMEEWELEYWPHQVTYQEIEAATQGFKEENVIGIGGNGKVYKGVLPGGTEIAVKRISHRNDGMREVLAEISSLGRLKHRNLVRLRGWSKKEKGVFMLVYDYMENGSLDKRVFDCDDESRLLSCEERLRILKDVASGVLYLHEGWEAKVLHRDIKASNVLLDQDMNARLGDFGLARVHGHSEVASTTRVVGTVGYLAPEMISRGRASTQTDVFSFGVLILEVMCGRRPIEEGKPSLVEMVWQLLMEDQLINALDEIIRARGGYNEEEVTRVIHLGLLCAYPDPSARPTMRQVLKVLEGKLNEGTTNECEIEDVDAYLLQQMKSKDMWFNYSQCSGSGSHPTFEDFRKMLSSSVSLSWSNTSAVEDFVIQARVGTELKRWKQKRCMSL